LPFKSYDFFKEFEMFFMDPFSHGTTKFASDPHSLKRFDPGPGKVNADPDKVSSDLKHWLTLILTAWEFKKPFL
jgi:hypothetical protein